MSTGKMARQSTRPDVTAAVATALADRENVPTDELSPPLYEVVDPEALASLFRNTSGRVTFEYREYEVTVDDDYVVEVRETR